MSDEKRRILELLSQGKVTVDEATELLQALGAEGSPAATAGDPDAPARRARWLRMTIDKNVENGRKKEVNLRIPAALVRAGVRLGSVIPMEGVKFGVGGKGSAAQIDPKDLEELLNNMGETTIDIEGGKAQVRIWCE